ncbi:MAG TPA: glycosyltransferase [Planctomycetaceae bacterium]|nr:glycosyltransferase [Planctomycetaceae bacterium]
MHVGIIFPETPEWPKMRWVHDALVSLGHEVSHAPGAQGFPDLSQRCDVLILAHKGLSGRWPNIRDAFPLRKAVVVQWWFDLIAYRECPLESQSTFRSNVDILRAADVVCVKERSLLDEYRSLGVNAHYLDQGCAVDVRECVRSESPRWDVLVWGQGGPAYPERCRDVQTLVAHGYRVAWAMQSGSVPEGVEQLPVCHPDRLPELAGQASCVLSCDRRHDIEGYWSDRFWMALGMGCCVLRRETSGLPEGPFITYGHRGELIDRLQRVFSTRSGDAADAPRWSPGVLSLGKEARTWCLENHTLAQRCRRMLEIAAAHSATGQAA